MPVRPDPIRTHVRAVQWPSQWLPTSSIVHGAREHNLKDITVRLPRNALICITGLSGSGKSSLAFDTIYAEGQRRYVESLSRLRAAVPADDGEARRRLDRRAQPGDLDRPEDDLAQPALDGRHRHRDLRLPAPALRARRAAALPDLRPADLRASRSTRSSSRSSRCPTGRASRSTRRSCATARASTATSSRSCATRASRAIKVDGEQHLLDEPPTLDKKFKHTIEVVVDRLVMKEDLRTRLTQSVETAVALAEGLVVVDLVDTRRDDDLLAELRLPRARRLAARAAAAHLLVQLAARRLPALHRPRRAAGDRPRPARARPVALDRRRRARAVGGRRLGLLRVGDPGDRRPLRDPHRRAVAGADRASSRTTSSTAPTATRSTSSTATGWAAGARTCSTSRGSSPRSSAATARPTRRTQRERIEEYMSFRPVPGLQGRAAQARGARGHRRRARTSTSSRSSRSRARSSSSTRST